MYIVHCFPFRAIHVILLEQRTRTHAHLFPPPRQTTLDACIQKFSKKYFTSYKEWGRENYEHCRAGVTTSTHSTLQFYPTKIASSSAVSRKPLKRQRLIRGNTYDDLSKCFTMNTIIESKLLQSAEKINLQCRQTSQARLRERNSRKR